MRRSIARGFGAVLLAPGLALLAPPLGAVPASAASLAPPMLDITGQCSATARRNVTAMSECVVAESEARAEILQQWDHISDANADRCIRAAGTSKHFPYSAIAKCLSEPAAVAPPVAVATTEPTKALTTKTSKGKSRKGKGREAAVTTASAAAPATAPAPAAPSPPAAPTSTFAKWKQFFSK